jgi:hypothetical protein
VLTFGAGRTLGAKPARPLFATLHKKWPKVCIGMALLADDTAPLAARLPPHSTRRMVGSASVPLNTASSEMIGSAEQEELEQNQKIEEAAALLTEMVESLQRRPSEKIQLAAREALMDLTPHVEAALEALEEIEEHRELTDRERDLKYAFKMLLEVRMLPDQTSSVLLRGSSAS